MASRVLPLLMIAATAAAEPEKTHQERPRDRPGAPATLKGPSMPFWSRGYPPTVQANVSPAGLNIVGDAANEPSIAVDPTARNRVVIGWRQFDTVSSNFRQAGVAHSRDGGRTWTKRTLDPGVFRSDPVLRASADGVIVYNSLTSDSVYHCVLFRSGDGGATWAPPVDFAGGDKQWMCIDTTDGPGRGNIYAHWSRTFSCCGDTNFTRSTDGGDSRLAPLVIPSSPWGTSVVDGRGRLFVAGAGISVVRSSNAQDAGQPPTFELARAVSLGGEVRAFTGGTPNPGGLLGQVSIGVDRSGGPHDGRVYVLASVGPVGTDPLNVMIAHSDDGGGTWSLPRKVNAEAPRVNAFQWFGTMSVAPSGRVDVVYNDTQGTGAVNLSITKYTSSSDGGITWSAPLELGPVWDSWIGWPNQNKIGDYYDMESDDAGAFLVYSATYNGEQDVYVARLGDYDCDGDGVADATQIADGSVCDCNGNGIPDGCEIAAGAAADADHDGVPDACRACPADFTGDGFLDFFDYDAYAQCFETGRCPSCRSADFNGDGFADFFDYDAFVGAFQLGC